VTHGRDTGRSGSLVLVIGELWPQASRLALAARDAGFDVHVIAPRSHSIRRLKWVRSLGVYSQLRPTRSVARALNARPFDLVIPTDQVSSDAVFEAYMTGRLNETTAAAVRRSLGDPSTFPIRSTRAVVAEIAASAGVSAPRTWAVPDEDSLAWILKEAGLPAVLKSDGSYGGRGVIIVKDEAGARAAYRALSRAPRTPDSLSWLLPAYDGSRPSRSRLWSRPVVTLQEFVDGGPATLAAVAWEGEVIGSLGFRVVSTWSQRGPATVVEPIQHPDLDRAAESLARGLGLSGLFGLDFILSADRSTASLLELNPRAVPTAHLRLPWQSRPLFHLLADRLGVDSPVPLPPLPADLIALFPQAWGPEPDDPAVPYGEGDVPDAEDVAELCLEPMVDGLRAKLTKRIMRIGVSHTLAPGLDAGAAAQHRWLQPGDLAGVDESLPEGGTQERVSST
jgi:ATP-grasp domain